MEQISSKNRHIRYDLYKEKCFSLPWVRTSTVTYILESLAMTNDIISIAKNKDTDSHLASKSKLLNKLQRVMSQLAMFLVIYYSLEFDSCKKFAY